MKKKPKEKAYPSFNEELDDEEIENFVMKLKRRTGKYKGKLPLICFNCGKIGHFASVLIRMQKVRMMKMKLLRRKQDTRRRIKGRWLIVRR